MAKKKEHVTMNRIWNARNPHQGEYLKVLCVCSAGILRSATLAVILSQDPYNYNTRAVGLDPNYALVPVDDVLIEWADEILCMNNEQRKKLGEMTDKPVINLDVPDCYGYREEGLWELLKQKIEELGEK